MTKELANLGEVPGGKSQTRKKEGGRSGPRFVS
jgi:hypothetical protein